MKEILLSFVASFSAAVLFNIDRKILFWAGVSGGIAWGVFLAYFKYSNGLVMSCFISAVAVSIFSESMARKLKTPAFIFSITGILPLVPGMYAYNAVQSIAENKLSKALSIIVSTINMALAIAFGIMMVSAMFYFVSSLNKKNKTI